MDRRKFLGSLIAGVAGIAIEQAIPLGRVWSFPKKIVIAAPGTIGHCLGFDWEEELAIGDIVSIDSVLRPFVVTRVFESGVDIWPSIPTNKGEIIAVSKNKIMRWPKFTAAFPPDSSHTPS